MIESNKILTLEYLNQHAKLSKLLSVLIDKIYINLYKKYKKETEYKLQQLSEAIISILKKPQTFDFKLFTFKTKPDPELIIKSILEYFIYLKF